MSQKKRLIFLGTPEVAARSLAELHNAAARCGFEICAVVSQAPARRSRDGSTTPTPVHLEALKHALPVLTPQSARAAEFLQQIADFEPDLCITAACGFFLPKEFLDIPKLGTLNIHPSLLPLYRGAAPVQRALQEGVGETGVSVAFTVLEMDAGPIVRQEIYQIDDEIKAPALLSLLFDRGTTLLIEALPEVFGGKCVASPQDSTRVRKAAKIQAAEAKLDFTKNARSLHNQVRAFAGWPGTVASFLVNSQIGDYKIITTRVVAEGGGIGEPHTELLLDDDAILVPCADGSVLGVMELQPPNRKVLRARDFWNGLRGQQVSLP